MIKCIAIDDEPIALSIIKEYCRKHGNIDLETFTSPVAGMESVIRTHPDIVFLDIEMNSHNGVELARELPPTPGTRLTDSTLMPSTSCTSRYFISDSREPSKKP